MALGRWLTPFLRDLCTGGDTDDDVSALFKKELQRRNISSVDELDQKSSSRDSARAGVSPPPFFAGTATEEVPPQLARSRALNSEGLEGLIPRATELIKLGGAFFLAFGPFIIAVALSFTAIYAVSGNYCVLQLDATHQTIQAINLGFPPVKKSISRSTPPVQVFGDSFVHSGRPSSGPPVYDPQELLAEPTVDPMVPM